MPDAPWNAIVLAGGRASRLGGLDKSALRFEGASLLEHAIASVARARRTVVVGPAGLGPRLPETVRLRTERPAFGGPAAALAAGLETLADVAAPRTAVLSCDLPHAVSAMRELLAVGRLADRTDGVVAMDELGIPQPLLAVYDTGALDSAVRLAIARGPLAGTSLRALLAPLVLCHVVLDDGLCADVDTPEVARRHGIALRSELAHV